MFFVNLLCNDLYLYLCIYIIYFYFSRKIFLLSWLNKWILDIHYVYYYYYNLLPYHLLYDSLREVHLNSSDTEGDGIKSKHGVMNVFGIITFYSCL